MKLRPSVLLIGFLLTPALAHANDFGILRTAIPVEKSVWRFGAGGIVSLEDNGREAFIVCGETGLNAKSDVSAKFSISGDDTAIGGAVNYLVMPSSMDFPVDISVLGGAHYITHDQDDTFVIDVAVLVSKEIKPKLSLYGAFDLGFGTEDGSSTAVALIPGVNYDLSDKAAVALEFGLGLSDYATNYFAALFRYTLR